MIDYTKIKTEFAELVGFHEENEISLSASLQNSVSGFYVNDLSGIDLISIEKSVFLKTDLTPENTVSEYLTKIYPDEVQKLVQKFIDKSSEYFYHSKILRNFELLKLTSQNKVEQEGSFNGYFLNLKNSYNLQATIGKLSLQISKAQTVRIFLYEISQKEAVATFDLIVDADYSAIMKTVDDFIIKFRNENKTNLTFLIGYYEYDENNIQSFQLDENTEIYEDTDFCHSDIDFFSYLPVKISNENLNWNGTSYDLPNFERYSITNGRGLNARFSQECDFTQIIIEYKRYFAETLANQLALRIIQDCNFSKEFNTITESNRVNWSQLILFYNNKLNGYEFEDGQGNSGGQIGLIEEIIRRFEGIDDVCFPKRRNTIL